MKLYWYAGGLHFECVQCSRCCSGPAAGYIWVSRPEIQIIADFLKMDAGELRRKFFKRVGFRTSIIEQPVTRDCAFLQVVGGEKRCVIYPVRPKQCRDWPFWSDNIRNADTWNKAAQRCRGINRGRFYSFDEIENIQKSKKWQQDAEQKNGLPKRVAEVYDWLDLQIRRNSDLSGKCETCGRCCDFAKFDHRLFVTTPELLYLAANLGDKNVKPMAGDRCPYNTDGKCTIYEYRFAGCRTFCCKGDADFQSDISESAVKKFKSICEDFQVPYRYSDLPSALNGFVGD